MVKEPFVDMVCYEVVGELGVNEGDPVVFAKRVREHPSLGGRELFECGVGLQS